MPSGPQRAIAQLLDAIQADPDLGRAVRHHEVEAPREAELAQDLDLLAPVRRVLEHRGIDHLYAHQARAIEALRADRDVVLATPTASGKSMVYSLPTLEAVLEDPEHRALYLFPLKALEQDQRAKLEQDIAALGLREDLRPRVEIYDGDTPQSKRKKIRENPPNILITTPDMLHLGILPHHASWERFFRGLGLVVIDELHTYRGVFGSHVAQVMRRLDRVARHHRARPRFVCASATVANPGELATHLTGRDFEVIEANGASRARRHVLLMNPQASPYSTAARLFRLSVGMGLRTIAFTKARRITELMHTWITSADPTLKDKISSYRAGFLPEERREIEQQLFTGELRGVISTSALELGIDVGGLDVCLLVGYPGSQIATWQRAGRVGRTGEAMVAMVAQPDALDQFLVTHPRQFFARAYEHAVLDPENSEIAAAHLPCAAAEVPLRSGETWLEPEGLQQAIEIADGRGDILESEAGTEWFASRRNPHRDVQIRSSGSSYAISVSGEDGERPRVLGTIGSANVFVECHEGAIYLHHGRQYRVKTLDLDEREVLVIPSDVPWYTRAQSEKETEILSRDRARPAGNFRLVEGRVKVTTRITSYERRRVRGQELLSTEPLDLPPTSYETKGIWFEIPDEIPKTLQNSDRHVMGALHAVEHASLALFPLFALCDRFDVAGITYKHHPQLGHAAIFLYDGHVGGLGLTSGVFDRIEPLLEATLEMVRDCPCESGCPACVHSPRCGNGNRPMDKLGAVEALEMLLGREPLPAMPEAPLLDLPLPAEVIEAEADSGPPPRLMMFDLETQRSAAEVGGWNRAHLMRVALAVVWDSADNVYHTFREGQIKELLAMLGKADLVIGFNVIRFDYQVLRGYTDQDFAELPTFDLLDAVHARLGFRVSLGHLGEETLGEPKSADGLQSLQWWKEGRIDEIEHYCQQDVRILKELFDHARERGHLIFKTKRGERVKLPMQLHMAELLEQAYVRTPTKPRRERRAPRGGSRSKPRAKRATAANTN
jgi:DEAD/DEAH box helicase domain-containing protein